MKLRSLFFALAVPFLAAPAFGSELRTTPSAVLELFTSQGCASCPPADALLTEIGARKDVIALAYHVDYWDYIGWRDTFGSNSFSDYQHAYATAQNKARVYTPQLIINGETDVVGSRRSDIVEALAKSSLSITLDLDEKDGLIAVSAAGNADFPTSRLWLVTFKTAASVAIKRGENKDRVLNYSHIVTARQLIGLWDPRDGVSVRLPVADLLGTNSDGAAILIQEDCNGHPGRIIGGTSFLR